MPRTVHKVIRGGRDLDRVNRLDLFINGNRIAEIMVPGAPAPADAEAIDAHDRLHHPIAFLTQTG